MTTDPRVSVPAAGDRDAVLREAGWAECSPEWLAAHPNECGTAPRVPGDSDVSHWHPELTADSQVSAWQCELGELTSIALPTPEQKRRIAEVYEALGDDETAFVWWGYAAAAGDRDAIDMVELLRKERS